MKYLNKCLIVIWLLIYTAAFAAAEMDTDFSVPGESIGVTMQSFPELSAVPGSPVYYAPQAATNYFFYDGMYWVYQDNRWFASTWYNGPWSFVDPGSVPLFVLRVPVRFYQQPPVYFSGWQPTAPPRWNQHWGHEWEQRHSGWNRWNHAAVPAPAPLPVYQRQYSGDRYPGVEQQRPLRMEHYRYQPRNSVVRRHLKQHEAQRAPAAAQTAPAPAQKSPAQPQIVPEPAPKAPVPAQKALPATQPPPVPHAAKAPPAAVKIPPPLQKNPPPTPKPSAQGQQAPPVAHKTPPPVPKKTPPPLQKAPPVTKAPPPTTKAPPPAQKQPPHVQKVTPPVQKVTPPVQKVMPPVHKPQPPVQKVTPPVQKTPSPVKQVPAPAPKAPVPEQKAPTQ